MKSRGLFPGPRSRPKRSFNSAAGNSEYRSTPPGPPGNGSLGWKAGRSAGGISGANRQTNRPTYNHGPTPGDGGLAWDSSADAAMRDAGKPDSGYQNRG